MQISLAEKLKENPEFLNNYAKFITESKKIKESDVCCHIINQFEESKAFVRKNLDKKYKNQATVNDQSKISKLKSKIGRMTVDLTISTALLETLVNSKK